jgi:membrane protease YdiL (CAAX protease family)
VSQEYKENYTMKLDQLTKKYPVIASLAVLIIVTVLTETPIQSIRSVLYPIKGRFYGDYLTDLILNALGTICLLLAAATVGLDGKLGLKTPRPWRSLLLGWPLVLLALPDVESVELVFDPTLFVILIFLYLFIGFFEELLFRGYVQGFLMRRWGESYRGMLLSVLLTSLIFGGAHLVNLIMGRATPLYAVVQFAYAVFFGVFFSALYVRSGSLFPGIGLHMFFDFMANLDAFRPGAPPRSEIVRSSTPEAAFVGILITLPLFLIGLYYLRKSKLQLPPEGR